MKHIILIAVIGLSGCSDCSKEQKELLNLSIEELKLEIQLHKQGESNDQ